MVGFLETLDTPIGRTIGIVREDGTVEHCLITDAPPPPAQLVFDVDIRDFGGVSGMVDATTALADAYAGLPATGGRIIVPAGIWNFPTEFTIDKPNVWLVGGPGSKLVKQGTDHHMVQLTGNAVECRITGLEFDGNLQPQGSLILCRGSHNYVYDNYLHTNGDVSDATPYANQSIGVCLDGQTSTCVHNFVFANRIVDNHDIGCSQNTAPDNEIASNKIIGNGLEGVTIDVASHRSRVHFNRIEGNCRLGGVGGIGADGSDLWEAIGNQLIATQGGRSGLKTQNNVGPCNFFIVNNNLVLDNGSYGLFFFNGSSGAASNGTVLGNVVRGNTTGSIRFDANSNSNTCVGNSINGVAVSDAGAGNSLANNV